MKRKKKVIKIKSKKGKSGHTGATNNQKVSSVTVNSVRESHNQ